VGSWAIIVDAPKVGDEQAAGMLAHMRGGRGS
jgi:hypothetical protein